MSLTLRKMKLRGLISTLIFRVRARWVKRGVALPNGSSVSDRDSIIYGHGYGYGYGWKRKEDALEMAREPVEMAISTFLNMYDMRSYLNLINIVL